jgi:CubicO group peptidase (beta-lactamase class C family)
VAKSIHARWFLATLSLTVGPSILIGNTAAFREGSPGAGQAGTTAQAIDAIMTAAYPPSQPGAALIVRKGGQTLVRKAFGMANLELQAPLQPEHVFALASLSKPFTAAAVLKLAEEHRLSIDDDITRFLPAYPTHGARITIEHLLTHTSGLSALSETSDLRAAAVQESPLIDVLGDWIKDLPPDFAPGERWAYSNWGFNLLGAIVERASGMSYGAYLEQRLFAPAGMTHTFYNDRRRIIPMRVTGYDQQGDEPVNVAPVRSRIFLPGGAATLLSTVDDLARWNESLRTGAVLAGLGRPHVHAVPIEKRDARELWIRVGSRIVREPARAGARGRHVRVHVLHGPDARCGRVRGHSVEPIVWHAVHPGDCASNRGPRGGQADR